MTLSEKTIMWLVPNAVFLIIVLLANTGVILAFTATNVDVKETEAIISTERLHYSPNGISKADTETGRVYTGLISAENFKNDRIENTLAYEEGLAAARIKADTNGIESKDIACKAAGISCAYLYEDKYEKEWVVLALASEKIGGKGISAYPEQRTAIFENKAARLETVVLMPK
ncbi:hypothetical protein HYU12_02895 [Candidatus Woesearchaeota archaeon]|nr:hypothetical protein [Candidatus Woesearchaeota archaeon]